MKIFTIENETNNITIHATIDAAEAVHDAERFSSQAGLAELTANWPGSRLVEIWNSLPGETPVTKFKDRATGVSRIWKAIQSLGDVVPATDIEPEGAPAIDPLSESEASVTPLHESEVAGTPLDAPVSAGQPNVAPEIAPSKDKSLRARKAPKATDAAPRAGSKTSQVIAMLRRDGGVTLEEIMTAMGWQQHTTRAMLSAGGSLTKNHGLTVSSEKVGDRRTYSIKA